MALAIKVLGFGQLTATGLTDLLVTTPVATGKAIIVKTMRFVNTNTTTSRTLNVVLTRSSVDRQVSPKTVSLAPGAMYMDDNELTIEAGDKLRGQLDATGTVDFVLSGIERDA